MTESPSNSDGAARQTNEAHGGEQTSHASRIQSLRRYRILLETLSRVTAERRTSRRTSRDVLSPEANRQESNTARMLPLRILSEDAAGSAVASCRFCFEGYDSHGDAPPTEHAAGSTTLASSRPATSDECSDGSDPTREYPPLFSATATTVDGRTLSHDTLVAPCACIGNSEWVHVGCLRRWQLHAASQTAAICSVCTVPFSLPPPRPPQVRSNALKRGTLLVHASETRAGGGGGTFDRTVILLLQGARTTRQDGVVEPAAPSGVIVNCVLNGDHYPAFDGNVSDVCDISWRRGGPVCGGRLGVLRYAIGHNLDVSNVGSGGRGRLESAQVYNDGQFRMVQERSDGSPALFKASSAELGSVLSLLAQNLDQSGGNAATGASSPSRRKIILFGGYCKWARGQLEQEVRRGLWKVCNAASSEDIIGSSVGRLWADLSERQVERLVPFDDLFEQVD